MKMIILAGGRRSTISDDQEGMPKPMLPIGGRPLLWHIMKHASACDINEFIVCGGYKVEVIKEYFLDFYIYQSDIQVNTATNTVKILENTTENWDVTVVDTGISTMPVGRVKRVIDIAGDDFIISYGDCLTDIPLQKMMNEYGKSSKDISVALARPSGRKMPIHFLGEEEIQWKGNEAAWTSAGVFVANKDAFIDADDKGDIEDILSHNAVSVYRHEGFFSSIETLRDKAAAEEMWNSGKAPWMRTV